MKTRHCRITNGQRAAVCALVLAGQTFTGACAVVDAPWRRLRDLLPQDWYKHTRRPQKWKGDLLKDLEEAYRDRSLQVDTIGRMFGIQRRQIAALAKRHGWPRRRGNSLAQLPVPLRKLPEDQLKRYRKLRPIIGRSAAEQVIFGGGR